MNYSHFYFPHEENLPLDPSYYDSRLGPRIGLIADFPIRKALDLQSGILFDIKGYKVEYPWEYYGRGTSSGSTQTQATTVTSLYYLDVPLLLILKAPIDGPRPFLLAGPELGFMLTAKESTKVTGGGETESGSITTSDNYPAIDVGLSAGGGVEFTASNHRAMIDGRYTWGLTNVNDTSNQGEHPIHNRTVTASVGIFF